jgi:hypothetical protein
MVFCPQVSDPNSPQNILIVSLQCGNNCKDDASVKFCGGCGAKVIYNAPAALSPAQSEERFSVHYFFE